MRLSCGNTLKWPGGLHLLGADEIKRFRRSAVVHGQDRDESRLRPVGMVKIHRDSTDGKFSITIALLIVVLIVIPLYLASAIIAVRSGLFQKGPVNPDESRAFWGFIGSGITASVTLMGLLLVAHQNYRSERRLALDTAVKGIGLTQTTEGKYGTNAVVAGSLATLAHLNHPVIAMRMLDAAWKDGAVDAGSAAWLISEVLLRGTRASQQEAAALFELHSTQLFGTEGGDCCIPPVLDEQWLPGIPVSARHCLMFGIVKMLISRKKSWWVGGYHWPAPIFNEIIRIDKDSTVCGFASEILGVLLSDIKDEQKYSGFVFGENWVLYDEMQTALYEKNKKKKTGRMTSPSADYLIAEFRQWMQRS